jgi:CRISPR/Cas system-associated exonuclease Cas4 (RecB family)
LIASAIPPQQARLAAPSKRNEENSGATSKLVNITPFDQTQTFKVETLELYLRCPRRYYYEEMLESFSQSEETAFLRYHRCLREVLNWVQEQHTLTGQVGIDAVLEQLTLHWATTDLAGHPFEQIYRKNAETMMVRALQVFSSGRKIKKSEMLQIRLTNGIVLFSPDHIEIDQEGKHIFRRMRTGRISSSELEKNEVYGLYHRAAQQLNLSDYQIEVFSLTNGQIEPANLTAKKIEAHCSAFDEAIQGILTGRFPPDPKDSRRCPRCPNYFICPVMPTA